MLLAALTSSALLALWCPQSARATGVPKEGPSGCSPPCDVTDEGVVNTYNTLVLKVLTLTF